MAEAGTFEWDSPERVEFFVQKQSAGISRQIDQEFLEFLGLQGSWRCLDVGCGPGILTLTLADRTLQAIGSDLSAAMIARAEQIAADRRVHNVRFVRTPAEAMPFDTGEFDLALATSVIFLLPDPLLGLREMARVVRPGGWVGTYNPSPEMTVATNQAYAARHGIDGFEALLLERWGGAAERNRRLTVTETEEIFSNAGLVDVTIHPAVDGLVLFAKGRCPEPDEIIASREDVAEALSEVSETLEADRPQPARRPAVGAGETF